MTTRTSLVRLIIVALFTAVLAGTWDVWWHAQLGRETFWSPPHLLLYASVIVAIAMGFYGWWKTRLQSWKWLSVALFLIPASAPFDELWHRIFGAEPVNSPLVVWSPPHIVIVLTLVGCLLLLCSHLRSDDDIVARHLLSSVALGAVLSLLLFLVSPLDPTGPFHLFGFAGAAASALLIAGMFVFAQERMRSFGSAVSVAGVFMLLSAMDFGHQPLPSLNVQPHDHPPGWLMIFSCIAPAALIDVLHDRPLWLRGGLFGLLHGAILYGFSSQFFEPQFQYSSSDMSTAIFASTIAGLLAGLVIQLVRPTFSHFIPSQS